MKALIKKYLIWRRKHKTKHIPGHVSRETALKIRAVNMDAANPDKRRKPF